MSTIFDHDPDAESTVEREVALRRIRFLMDFWGITSDELESDIDAPVALAPPPVQVLPPKYRHPDSGDTWDGIGEQPDWLRRALLQEGLTVEQLRECARSTD